MSKTKSTPKPENYFYRFFPHIAGIITLVIYLSLAWSVLAPQAIWSPDEGVKLLQMQSLRLEGGRLATDIHYPGREIDPELLFAQDGPENVFIQVRDNRQYFDRLPLFPLLSRPFFALFGLKGIYILPALCGALTVFFALDLLRPADRRPAMWAFMALGSPLMIYATTFWEHTLASSLGLGGMWLAFHLSPLQREARWLKRGGWIAVGLLTGLSIAVRLEMVFFILGFLIAYGIVVKPGRWTLFWAMFPLLLGGIAYILLNTLIFGASMPNHSNYLFYPFRYLSSAGLDVVPEFLIGPHVRFWGVLWAWAAVTAIVVSLFDDDNIAYRWLKFGLWGVTIIIAASFLFTNDYYRTAHGFLFTTPWALLGMCRGREVWQRGDWRAKVIVLTLAIGLTGYVIALVGLRGSRPNGGLEWGMRFAIMYYPLLALLAAWDLGKKPYDLRMIIVIAAFIFLGIGFQTRGLSIIKTDKAYHVNINHLIVDTPPPYIVSDLWWLGFNAAPIYNQKSIFIAITPHRMTTWVNLAASQGVKRFTLVTFKATLPNQLNETLTDYKLTSLRTTKAGEMIFFDLRLEPR